MNSYDSQYKSYWMQKKVFPSINDQSEYLIILINKRTLQNILKCQRENEN